MSELFRHIQEEKITRVPNRPLGEFSNFVVTGLTSTLTAIREGKKPPSLLGEITQGLCEGLTVEVVAKATSTSESADVALLDLLFLDNALVRATLPNPKLTELIETLAVRNRRPSVITYEDLILINPIETDCRTYTDGEIGSSERDFYVAHREIETELDVLVDATKIAIDMLGKQRSSAIVDVASIIHTAGLRWPGINERMGLLWKSMPTDHFSAFRQYFLPHPTRIAPDGGKYKGPSGAFTANIPIFEILFAGEKMKPEQFDYFSNNAIYFPREGRRGINDALQHLREGLTLTQLSNSLGNPPELMTELTVLDGYLNQFRGMHYAGVKKQIPGAIEGKVSGSAGENNVGKFLKGRIINHVIN